MSTMKDNARVGSTPAAGRRRAAGRSATAILALLLSAGAAAAQQAPALGQAMPQQPPAAPTLAQMTAEADLVFRGIAEDVQYVLSAPGGPEATRAPYTFVTYRIKDVLRGQAPVGGGGGATITLQFIGGLDVRDDTFLMPSITPRIEAGDEDILFVTGNTQELVPLVGDVDGRIRVIGHQVYTEMGNAIVPANAGGGDIDVGWQYRLKEVETLKIQNGPALKIELGSDLLELPSNAMTADRFAAMVRAAAQQAQPAAPVVSADATRPVAAPDMTPSAPPALHPDQGAPAQDEAPQHLPARR